VYQLTEEVITKEYDNDKFLAEVIEPGKSRRIAIIGEPGAGKTTLQEKIAVWLHDNNKGLPICIPLGGLQGKSLEDYLQQIWLKMALRFIEPDALGVEVRHIASLKQQFREGKVWLLLDGVDEMAATSPVEALATIKEQLTDWLAEARVVLTCRLNVWDANVNTMLTGFETYRTLEFKPEQVEDFIRQWFACAKESQRGEELLRKLQETGKERIRELVRNPLRLSLLCQTSYVLPVDEPLPETKAALYERFTRYFYEWKQEQHPTTRTERRQLNQALGELAKAGINSKVRFRLGEDFACDVMGEPLFDLACRLGWLNLVDREAKTDEAVYAFFHPTFQEYFAACAIDDWDYFLPCAHDNNNPKPVSERYRIFEPQWKEVFLLWLGRKNLEEEEKQEKEALIKKLGTFDDGCGKIYQYQAYSLAAAGLAEFRECSFAYELVDWFVARGFGYFNVEQQKWDYFLDLMAGVARAALLETDRSLAVTALIDLIRNPTNNEEYILRMAAWGLGQIGMGSSEAIETLIPLISTSTHDATQYKYDSTHLQAIESLGKIGRGNQAAISVLLNLIYTRTDDSSRVRAAESLGKITPSHKPEAAKTLIDLIRPERGDSIRCRAAYSLVQIAPEYSEEAINALIGLIHSPDSFAGRSAIHYLTKIAPDHPEVIATCHLMEITYDSPESMKELIDLIRNNSDTLTRYLATEKLVRNIQIHQLESVVSDLKNCLSDQVYENDYVLYDKCYEIIWHCAQNMTYPDFYEAWHHTSIHQRR
jgi:GTPase SAR1 family protein